MYVGPMLRSTHLSASLLAVLTLTGCSGCTADESAERADPGDGSKPGAHRIALSLIDALPGCDVDYRGLLLDMGSASMRGRYDNRLDLPRGIALSERNGASWAQIYDRSVELRFLLPEVGPVFVSLRAVGRDATRISASLDGLGLGTLVLGRDEVKVVATRPTEQPVDAGLHTLRLDLHGGKSNQQQPFAEIDWVRIGVPDELPRTYGAPTVEDVLVPGAQLGGVPHRAFSLHAPGSVRCSMRVPERARLKLSMGMRGAGSGSAAVLVHEDDAPPTVVQRIDVAGGDEAAWHDADVDLSQFGHRVVSLELAAIRTTGSGRLMFGDPVIEAPDVPQVASPQARAAVVVVLGGVDKSELPPWRTTETPHLPTLNRLVKSASVFDQHRGSSTVVAASMATLLTSLPVLEHGVVDAGAKLAASIRTLPMIASDASVRAAMFTGVPFTFEPFGFGAHWDKFHAFAPNEGAPAVAPLSEAAKWLSEPAAAGDLPALLALVHARGGHPPWDVTPDEAAKLAPADYAGALGPRSAAQVLAGLMGKAHRLSEGDHERMRALYLTALSGQDMALGKLIAQLEEAGRWDSTLLIVTADVASARATLFRDALEPNEDLLSLPLYVHFPGGLHAGERVGRATETQDVTHTVMAALGLEPAAGMLGRDLAAIAAGAEHGDQLRVALTSASFSARWGDLVLNGRPDERSRLCRLSLDPTCAFDRTHHSPIAAQAIFRELAWFVAREAGRGVAERQPVTLDSEMAAMLSVWGAQ